MLKNMFILDIVPLKIRNLKNEIETIKMRILELKITIFEIENQVELTAEFR